jgi:hypothetical protein
MALGTPVIATGLRPEPERWLRRWRYVLGRCAQFWLLAGRVHSDDSLSGVCAIREM